MHAVHDYLNSKCSWYFVCDQKLMYAAWNEGYFSQRVFDIVTQIEAEDAIAASEANINQMIQKIVSNPIFTSASVPLRQRTHHILNCMSHKLGGKKQVVTVISAFNFFASVSYEMDFVEDFSSVSSASLEMKIETIEQVNLRFLLKDLYAVFMIHRAAGPKFVAA